MRREVGMGKGSEEEGVDPAFSPSRSGPPLMKGGADFLLVDCNNFQAQAELFCSGESAALVSLCL